MFAFSLHSLFTAAILPPHIPHSQQPFALLFSTRMETLFEILAILQIAAGPILLWQGILWLAYVQRRLQDRSRASMPLARLCSALAAEWKPASNAIWSRSANSTTRITKSSSSSLPKNDPAHSILKRVVASSRVKAHIVIAGKPAELLARRSTIFASAIEQLPPGIRGSGLRRLRWPPRQNLAASNSLPPSRIPVSAPPPPCAGLFPHKTISPTALLAAWNAPVVTMLGGHTKNFCWGGGTAIRRSHLRSDRHDGRLAILLQRRLFPHHP